ncbi:hypothetical protein [Kutzneria sp. 744]|uniref:hypothetical protein n=1 Tax=Kutzneria sp. (strain 744) TaxID=345341 RepID=UPI0005BDCD24|nr:hypothetical protein [Kutzneria sp. 744]
MSPGTRFRLDTAGCVVPCGQAVITVAASGLTPVRLNVTALAVLGRTFDRSTEIVPFGPTGPPLLRVSRTRVGLIEVYRAPELSST